MGKWTLSLLALVLGTSACGPQIDEAEIARLRTTECGKKLSDVCWRVQECAKEHNEEIPQDGCHTYLLERGLCGFEDGTTEKALFACRDAIWKMPCGTLWGMIEDGDVPTNHICRPFIEKAGF